MKNFKLNTKTILIIFTIICSTISIMFIAYYQVKINKAKTEIEHMVIDINNHLHKNLTKLNTIRLEVNSGFVPEDIDEQLRIMTYENNYYIALNDFAIKTNEDLMNYRYIIKKISLSLLLFYLVILLFLLFKRANKSQIEVI